MPVLEVGKDVSVFRYLRAGKPEKKEDHLSSSSYFSNLGPR